MCVRARSILVGLRCLFIHLLLFIGLCEDKRREEQKRLEALVREQRDALRDVGKESSAFAVSEEAFSLCARACG